MKSNEITPIAYIRTDYKEKFGIPRQSMRAENIGKIVFCPEYRVKEAIRGIEEFNYLWLIFDFSKAHRDVWSPTVRPPRLGGNRRVGVFATRSPFRPNSLGLSSVKLLFVAHSQTDGDYLIVSGADLLDKTPIYDIKPYIPTSDCHTDALGAFSDTANLHRLDVIYEDGVAEKIPHDKIKPLTEALSDDPRPSYQSDPERIYKMKYADFEISFCVSGNILTVKDVDI